MVKFARALNAVENVAKTETANAGSYQYSYADLGDVLGECKRACQMFDLAISQHASVDNGMLTVGTQLIDAETGESHYFLPLTMKLPNDAQALGSAITYGRRYALLTIFGIAPEDDDGRAATRSENAPALYGGYRSGAEQRIHEVIKALPEAQGKALRDAFRTQFGPLSELAVSKHGDALTWTLAWSPPDLNPGDDAADLLQAQAVMDAAQNAPIDPQEDPG
jgi:hypothetical protein